MKSSNKYDFIFIMMFENMFKRLINVKVAISFCATVSVFCYIDTIQEEFKKYCLNINFVHSNIVSKLYGILHVHELKSISVKQQLQQLRRRPEKTPRLELASNPCQPQSTASLTGYFSGIFQNCFMLELQNNLS